MSGRAQTERLLGELIALPSVNPAFLPAGSPLAGEQRVTEFLAAIAARGGLDVDLQPVSLGRANLLARLLPPGKVEQRILLAPHLDTVNGAPAQFTPRRRGTRLYGRGACDTKGSVAAMISALLELARSGKRPQKTEIIFAGLVDEEHAQAGSRTLAARGMKADLAIVGEPTNLQLITAHKGTVWLRLITRGKSAHGARPELGSNAVHAMARIVDFFQTAYATDLRLRKHPLLGRATISVGSINGGTQANIVPDYCVMTADRRTLPGETESSVEREILSMLRKKKLKAQIERGKLAPCLPLETHPRLPLVAAFMRSIGQSRPLGVDYFCDAAILAQGGTPSVVFGPGDIAQAHTSDEWINVKELEQAKSMLVQFLSSLP